MSNGKVNSWLINDLTVGLLMSLYNMRYFAEPYNRSKNKIKVELNLYNYAKKSDLKTATPVDLSKSAKELDSA